MTQIISDCLCASVQCVLSTKSGIASIRFFIYFEPNKSSFMSIHIAAKAGQIAPIVLMPGDPLRAKYIAENNLDDLELVSSTRNIYFFTGNYKGTRLTIGASG